MRWSSGWHRIGRRPAAGGRRRGETVADIRWCLKTLTGRFRKVVRTVGNHELWSYPRDTFTLRGVDRYEHLVELCRELGVTTPEDPYPV